MPELPEVETTLRGLERPLAGRAVAQVTVRNPALRWPVPQNLDALLRGKIVRRLSRRAKYLLLHFDHGALIVHLGMSGRLCHLQAFEPPGKHDHVDLRFDNGAVLRLRDPRRFGAVLWTHDVAHHPVLAQLGIEPLEETFDGAWLHRQLRARSCAIKQAIMDGHLVVGVGNIYASESLFRARINPKLSANKLSRPRCERLAQEIKATLNDAIRAGGSSLRDFFGVDGNPGYFQQEYHVYSRAGAPCKICDSAIKTLKQGQRSTFYCPRCQVR
ncbi:MAG: bifunctional DNA-formamidopyrimidine glycosylase/DNA-(apurinic or apyrimidinic site) lyase [Methylobacillus sp.]|jgi:formamidopyrimidine-DNA glycosylase|nr:bifunctional DNA-formamidopyrimidine glycosylase/DNA-(apurinic or apyrimidinic site) lyase [Methylobacillus sp.]